MKKQIIKLIIFYIIVIINFKLILMITLKENNDNIKLLHIYILSKKKIIMQYYIYYLKHIKNTIEKKDRMSCLTLFVVIK